MKPLLFLTALMLFLSYCGGKNHTDRLGHKSSTAATPTEATTASHIEHAPKLTLNNGQKWRLDEPTRKNIGAIKTVVDKAAAQPVPNYHEVASDLQAATDKLIGECRMSGPDHEALHQWLEGYLPALKELHKDNKPMQRSAFQSIRTKVQEFSNYFE